MPRIKILDLPPASHFSQKQIQRRLTAFFRSSKLSGALSWKTRTRLETAVLEQR